MPTTKAKVTTELSDLQRTIYSKELLLASEPVLKFAQFAIKKTDLTTQIGKTITITKINNIARGGALGEIGTSDATSITMQSMGTGTATITVGEFGNGISISELQLQTSFHDTLAQMAVLLGRDYGRVVDDTLRDTVFSAPNIFYGDGVPANRAALTSNDKFVYNSVSEIHERLAVNKVPPFFEGGSEYYIAFVHPHQSRTLRRDNTDFVPVIQYGDPSRAYNGEIGKLDKVRFIETTALPIYRDATALYAELATDATHVNRTALIEAGAMIGANASSLGALPPAPTSIPNDTKIWLKDRAEIDGNAIEYPETISNYKTVQTTSAVSIVEVLDVDTTVTPVTTRVYGGCAFGDYAYAIAYALEAELRDGGTIEQGRAHELVWYAIFGTAILNDENIILFETV